MALRSASVLSMLMLLPLSSFGEAWVPVVLPLPARTHAALAGGRSFVSAHPEVYITVGAKGCEFTSIMEALARKADGRNKICLMDPVHRESGIKIEGEVAIYGFGAAATAIEAAARPEDAVCSAVETRPGAKVLLSGLTIRHGNPMEGFRVGGGIANFGSCTVEDCAIVENTATAGAGLWSEGRVVVRRSLIASNRVIHRPAAEESAAIGCRGAGGGVKVDKGCSALFEDCLIAWNESLKGGAGIHVSCGSEATMSNCTVYGNSAGGRGAGVELAGGELELERCTVAANVGTGPGKALFNRGLLSISGSLLASEYLTAYTRDTGGGGDIGVGTLVRNEGNYCQSGALPGAATGDPGPLALTDNGGATWSVLPEPGSPARGYGTVP